MKRCACPDPLTLRRIVRCTVDGRFAWRSRCTSCQHLWFGTESDREDALEASGPAIGGPDVMTRGESSNSLRRGLVIDGLPPLIQRMLERNTPFENPDPYVVVTDAALKDGVIGWGLITGIGWEESAAHLASEITNAKNQPLYSPAGAELYAITRAVSLYPPGSNITVLTDCQPLVRDWRHLDGGHLLGRDWVPSAAQNMHSHNKIHGRTVRLQYVSRDTPLLVRAHRLAIHARLNFTPDSPTRIRPGQFRNLRNRTP